MKYFCSGGSCYMIDNKPFCSDTECRLPVPAQQQSSQGYHGPKANAFGPVYEAVPLKGADVSYGNAYSTRSKLRLDECGVPRPIIVNGGQDSGRRSYGSVYPSGNSNGNFSYGGPYCCDPVAPGQLPTDNQPGTFLITREVDNRGTTGNNSGAPKVGVQLMTSVEETNNIIRNASGPVIVDFCATWCEPCKKMAPIFEALAQKYAGRATFLKVQTDKMDGSTEEYSISGLPTFKVFKHNREVGTIVGSVTESRLASKFQQYL